MSHARLKRLVLLLITVGLGWLLVTSVYNLPYVQDRIGWRISELRAKIKYALSPPEQAVFTPDQTVAAIVQSTLSAFTPTATPTPSATRTPGPTDTPTITYTPTITSTPIPANVHLSGVRHEFQRWNNCGPANLSMALSYWGWRDTQYDTAAVLKPNQRDKNIMPYEMAAYVEEQTEFGVVIRVGGELEMLKRFIAAGFPVLIEKGYEGASFDGWMGHYQVLTGYDDDQEMFTVQDSYRGPDKLISYDNLQTYWRHFNYLFLVIYPPGRETEVLTLLGPYVDETYAQQYAAQKASNEIFSSTGRPQFFAWFNRATNLMLLQDYGGAAAAYDEAFQVYNDLDPEIRPWRIMWYQTGPYWAYFYTGRYYDVINLATLTLENMSEKVLEESYYWRALAKEALGDIDGAINDLRTSVSVHPDWEPGLIHLERLGAVP
jgi:hypothetical protein